MVFLRRYRYRRIRRRPARTTLRMRMAMRRRAAVRRRLRAFRLRRPRRSRIRRGMGVGREVKVNATYGAWSVVWKHDGSGHGWVARLSAAGGDPAAAAGYIWLGGTGNGHVTGKSMYVKGCLITMRYLLANTNALNTLTGQNPMPEFSYVVMSPRNELSTATIPDDLATWPTAWKYLKDYRGVNSTLANDGWLPRDKIKMKGQRYCKIWKHGKLRCHIGSTWKDEATPANTYMVSVQRSKNIWVPVNRRVIFRDDQVDADTGNINATTPVAIPIHQDLFLFMTSNQPWGDGETYLIPYVVCEYKWYYADDA